MNIIETNTIEEQRLNTLINEAKDSFNKNILKDDLTELRNDPAKYWLRFDLKVFQPGNIIETQRMNTIAAMQNHYSK